MSYSDISFLAVSNVARIVHEANRAYCIALGDNSQPSWDDAPAWQRESAINGVKFKLENPYSTPEQQHQNWLNKKAEEGWKYGPVKDVEKKEHPCFVPYHELPQEQRMKDALFGNIVKTLSGYL